MATLQETIAALAAQQGQPQAAGSLAGLQQPQGAALGGIQTLGAQPQSPLGGQANRGQIQQAFQDILGRSADAPGLNFFLQNAASGQSIEDIRRSISNSAEALGGTQTGLAGAEQAFLQAQARQGDVFNQAASGFDPFLQQGQGAASAQAALAGGAGPEAQRAALANLQPVSQFLQDRGEQTIARNAARLGGLGGGNVRKELVQFGQNLAGESAQQQFQNLGTIAQRGFGAAQGLGTIRQNQAAAVGGFGRDIAAGRTRAGEGIASAVGGTTSALANLLSQQGGGISDIIGGTTGNLANLLAGAGQQAGGANEQLATILANLATQQASQTAGLPGLPGVQQSGGILGGIGQAAGGVGTLIGSLAPAAPVVAASDVRLKENIVPAGVSAGGHNLYSWDWNEDGKRIAGEQPTFGVLAQEVRAIDPDAVHVGADGFLRVDYKRIH